MSNRFAVLNLDDSDVETPVVKQVQPSKTKNIECRVCHEEHWSKDCSKKQKSQENQSTRNWNLHQETMEGKRDWHLKPEDTKQSFRPFSKGKVFQQPHQKKSQNRPRFNAQDGYMFQEEDTSISLKSIKHPTPEDLDLSGNEIITLSHVPELLDLQESSLAEKIKKALERQEKEKSMNYKDLSGSTFTSLKFNRVISVKKKD